MNVYNKRSSVAAASVNLRGRECARCGFTLPLTSFAKSSNGHAKTCRECLPGEPLFTRVAHLAVDMMLRVIAARALLYMGLPIAAEVVLDYRNPRRWPTLNQARRMQRLAS